MIVRHLLRVHEPAYILVPAVDVTCTGFQTQAVQGALAYYLIYRCVSVFFATFRLFRQYVEAEVVAAQQILFQFCCICSISGFFCIDNEGDELFTVGLITTFEEASFFITLFNNFYSLFVVLGFRWNKDTV